MICWMERGDLITTRQCECNALTKQHNKSSPTTESKTILSKSTTPLQKPDMQPTTSHLVPDAKGEYVKAEES
jgi:hypothetical protein